MADNKNVRENKHGKTKWIVIFTLFVVLLIGGLSAKYISEKQKSVDMTSSQFYFTSDYLKEDGKEYQITDWTDGFDIELYNYDKDDTAKVSENDIEYQVSITGTGDWTCTEGNEGKLTLGTDEKNNQKTIHIKPGNTAQKGDKITVTVKTTSPYQKSISATFTAESSNKPDYTITDIGDGSVSLIIQTNDYEGPVTVKWNKDFYDPDNTNKYMQKWEDSSETGSLEAVKNTTYRLLFFKNTTTNITTIKGSGKTITMPTK